MKKLIFLFFGLFLLLKVSAEGISGSKLTCAKHIVQEVLHNSNRSLEELYITDGGSSIDENSTEDYNCVGFYSNGDIVEVSASWTENSSYASVNSSGLVTTGEVSSDQTFTLTASYGGLTKTKTITIVNLAPVLEELYITDGGASIDENSTQDYNCVGYYSDGDIVEVSATWSENSSYASVNSSGLVTTGEVPSDQTFTLTASYGGLTKTKTITIVNIAPVLEELYITDGGASIDENSTMDYNCVGYYSNGDIVEVPASWSENSSYATVNSGGLVTTSEVPSDQTFTLTASYEGETVTKTITITNIVTLDAIYITDGGSSIDENSTEDYDCAAYYSDGTIIEDVAATWVEDSDYASVSTSGLVTTEEVSSDQTFILTASYEGEMATKTITITNIVTLDSIYITEGGSSIDENSTEDYNCAAHYSDGSIVEDIAATWSEDSDYATVNTDGLVSTTEVPSDQEFILTALYEGQTTIKVITINNIVTLDSIYITDGGSSIDENSTEDYNCAAYYSDGTIIEDVAATWSEDSDYATVNTDGLVNSTEVPTDQIFILTAGFEGQTTTMNITILNENTAPIANAGSDFQVEEGDQVILDGSDSYDPDGDNLEYSWISLDGIVLSNSSAINPNFIAPEVNSNTNYRFVLQVNDGILISNQDTVIVTVINAVGLDQILKSNVQIYPNPTRDIIYIQTNEIDIKQLIVTNIEGAEILNDTEISQKQMIDLSAYADGVYLVRLVTASSVIFNKIIKSH